MRSKILSSLLVLALTGCIKETEIPEHFIQKEEMSMIMADLIVAENVCYSLNLSKDSTTIIFQDHYKPNVLVKYNKSISEFDSSLQFYTEHPEVFKSVTDSTEMFLKKQLEDFEASKKSE